MNTATSNLELIWVADDDPDDRLILKEAFEENNFLKELQFFEDGELILNKLQQVISRHEPFPGLIVLDLNMPKVNGQQVLAYLKENDTTNNIPVIILSTSKSEEDRQVMFKLGAEDFITKPYSFDEMIKIAGNLITRFT